MKPGKIRPLAICVFKNGDRILAAKGFDWQKQQFYYRPLGGKIEFCEHAASTVQREIMEELGLETTAIRYLGTIENIFVYQGESGHEIVLIFDGEFIDQSVYSQEVIIGTESGENEPFRAEWINLNDFSTEIIEPITPLYPTGLIELLKGNQ